MAVSVLTPLQLDAGAGLLQNQGLAPNAEFVQTVAAYTGNYSGTGNLSPQTTVTGLLAAIKIGGASILSNTVIASLQTLASNSCPALSDSVPTAYTSNFSVQINPPGFTGVLTNTANTYLGNGDLTKFVQAFDIAQSYVNQTNLFVNSAVNSQTYLGNTFTTMNDMITGDVSKVNLATQAFGTDLVNLGSLIDLANLNLLGYPLTLIQQVVSVTGNLPVLSLLLLAEGVPEEVVFNLTDPNLNVTNSVQKLMYQAMTKVIDNDLDQILTVLKITTSGIENMADLLNPVKLFPNSYQSLTVPTARGLRAIYVNSTGAINTNLLTELPSYVIDNYNLLQQIIPADQALANKALAMSLNQVTGISLTTLPVFAQTVKALQTTQDLPLISALTQAVPASVADYYTNTLGTGTGNDNVLITDVLGTAIGWISTDALGNTVATFSTMNLAYLKTIYQTMTNTVNGQYTVGGGTIIIPPGTPAAGTYSDVDLAFEGETANVVLGGPGLIPVALAEISNIVAAYPAQVTSLNQDWNAMCQQLILENDLQIKAGLNYANLTANQQSSMYGFIFGLPNYGTDTSTGGTAQFIEGVADLTTFTGQAVVACLREGRNQSALGLSGIYTNSNIPADPVPPPPEATLLPSTYSEAEAANLVIR